MCIYTLRYVFEATLLEPNCSLPSALQKLASTTQNVTAVTALCYILFLVGHLPLFFIWGALRLCPLGTPPLLYLLHQPRMMDGNECAAVGGMIGRENWSTRRKLSPVPLCPPQISHDLSRARTRAAAVGSRRLTAWTSARPILGSSLNVQRWKWGWSVNIQLKWIWKEATLD
jgi:hypothetical protein